MPFPSSNDAEGSKLFSRLMESHVSVPGPNGKATVLFDTIQRTFDGSNMGKEVTVDPYLIHNLAACASIAMLYDRGQKIPWDQSDHDHILQRTWNGFLKTLRKAIKEGRTHEVGDKTIFGHFHIPDWFVESVKLQS